ncbi:hypothetical protein [Leucobacter sp. wl10]|uniref:PH-like domain-containing protein n=1 Tax=Leucobacter sp. wl10 TaxID=2304677 RepID=UPI000E5A8F34|nr:hypothetical protein [Leucobacter sp. wl10]RGE19581.1 hypothetical protein D1J51_11010 [Leucobacter sp. wl10]
MSTTTYVALMAVIAAIALIAMGLSWRARARRDTGIEVPAAALAGERLAHFPRTSYVSTTPEGAPFDRLSVPGLRFKGYAAVTVLSDGVVIAVTGEDPVRITAERLRGSGTASSRVGKAVEPDGLSLLRWSTGDRVVESSFRFASSAEQVAFAEAIDRISPTPSTSQEGAK